MLKKYLSNTVERKFANFLSTVFERYFFNIGDFYE